MSKKIKIENRNIDSSKTGNDILKSDKSKVIIRDRKGWERKNAAYLDDIPAEYQRCPPKKSIDQACEAILRPPRGLGEDDSKK